MIYTTCSLFLNAYYLHKKDRKPIKEIFRERPLKGTSLLLKIKAITGSSKLKEINGSIKELEIE